MGLFTAPLLGLMRVFEEVADQAEKELYNEEKVKTELSELHASLEAGEISEEEFTSREEALVQRLVEIDERKEQKKRHVQRKKRGPGRRA